MIYNTSVCIKKTRIFCRSDYLNYISWKIFKLVSLYTLILLCPYKKLYFIKVPLANIGKLKCMVYMTEMSQFPGNILSEILKLKSTSDRVRYFFLSVFIPYSEKLFYI